MLGNKYPLFGDNYAPYNVIIGAGCKVKYSDSGADGIPSNAVLAAWRSEVVASSIEHENLADNAVLKQNYPNPFNPETTIDFSLKAKSSIMLSVYNVKGELIQELVNDTKEAGLYSVKFNGSQLNSGIYFYKLITADGVFSKKMILAK